MDTSDSPETADVWRDPWAIPIITTVACVVIAGAPVFHDYVQGSAVLAIRTLLCVACVVVGIRRWHAMTGGEVWILGNLAVFYNPIYPFHLYERERWFALQAATGALLVVALYRESVPGRQWRAAVIGFIVGVYVASLVGESLIAGHVDRAPSELVALPVSLAATTWLVSFIAALAIGVVSLFSGRTNALIERFRR